MNLQDDLAMALKAKQLEFKHQFQEKMLLGIEVPNEDTQTIYLREMLESEIFQNSISPFNYDFRKRYCW